jgi:hypothetical protein
VRNEGVSGRAGCGGCARAVYACHWHCGGLGSWGMGCGCGGAWIGRLCRVARLVVRVGKRVKSEGNCVWCGVGGAWV